MAAISISVVNIIFERSWLAIGEESIYEQEVLAFFGTDLDSIRDIAEALGLLKPRLNLAAAMSNTDDCWF